MPPANDVNLELNQKNVQESDRRVQEREAGGQVTEVRQSGEIQME